MRIRPIGERVLIRQEKKEERTTGGIFIPDSAKEEKKQGTIIAMGQFKGEENPLKEGDKVIYGGYSSDEIEIDGEKHIFVDLKDILAKIE